MYFANADLQKCLLSEMKLLSVLNKLVKLHLPPPDILIFSAIFEECSKTKDDSLTESHFSGEKLY